MIYLAFFVGMWAGAALLAVGILASNWKPKWFREEEAEGERFRAEFREKWDRGASQYPPGDRPAL